MKSPYHKLFCRKIYRYVIIYYLCQQSTADVQRPFSNKCIRQPKIIFAEKIFLLVNLHQRVHSGLATEVVFVHARK